MADNEWRREDGRLCDELRSVSLERGVNCYAEGSCLASFGKTKVLCTASVEEKVPPFLRGTGSGWVTAEYSLLPRSTSTRVMRDITRGRLNGRSSEIQRLIGRSLRAAVDLKSLGERTIWIDCDVLQADGGTRTAAITGGFVALVDALRELWRSGRLSSIPLRAQVAAVSVGRFSGAVMTDLCYLEDSQADVDMNVVIDGQGRFIELQGTGEGASFSRDELNRMLDQASRAVEKLTILQDRVIDMDDEEVEALASS
ncbi:MAG: ribonuclease PH [Dethiosulfovibrio peptidovorans]|nr:MAG: ribonuclease PH [Dethiosulfovibrio peptidovorans]